MGCGEPEPFKFVVNGRVLFYVKVPVRDISLGLVIIIIGNKIFDGVLRKKLLELHVKLGGECFVVRYHNGGPVCPFNHLRHGEGFSRTRDAEQGLELFTLF